MSRSLWGRNREEQDAYEAGHSTWRAARQRLDDALDSQPYRPVGTPLTPEQDAAHRARSAEVQAEIKDARAAEKEARAKLKFPWEK
ncbi:hypothetical protein [Streptomyces sp. NRRL F-5135]|uniref:hypothetical protein n=1 Tax=Streptomyces sp. NRRL F-5135 TaxID=1463858 RepID=UPI0004CC454C|nr:hypothetical protein [Streptomyces sp. NRRL F-5135]